jgi:hypothetical protein
MNNKINTINKNLIVGGLVASLAACGGSGSNSAPVVSPPVVVAPPVVVEPSGLTLEGVVEKFNVNGGLNLTQNVSGNISYGSGNDVTAKVFSFSVENSNGSKSCVSYSGQDDSSVVADRFKFNSLDCDRELVVGGKSDFDAVLGDFNNNSASAVVNSPVSAGYDIYDGSSVSFNDKNVDISSCVDSVTGSSDYVGVSAGTDGKTNVDLYSGIYGNELSSGNAFSVSCEGTDVNGELVNFEDVASLTASYSSVPASRLVDIIKNSTGSTMAESTENQFDMDNGYNSRIDVNFVSGSSVGYDVQTVDADGVDVKLNVGTGSDFYKNGMSSDSDIVFDELLNRSGTIVFDELDKTTSYPRLFQNIQEESFNGKNLDNYNISCEIESQHDRSNGSSFNLLFSGVEDSKGFSNVKLENLFNEDYHPSTNRPNQVFYDDNLDDKKKIGNHYIIGNIDCSFENIESGETFKIDNMSKITGKNSDDKVNYINLLK